MVADNKHGRSRPFGSRVVFYCRTLETRLATQDHGSRLGLLRMMARNRQGKRRGDFSVARSLSDSWNDFYRHRKQPKDFVSCSLDIQCSGPKCARAIQENGWASCGEGPLEADQPLGSARNLEQCRRNDVFHLKAFAFCGWQVGKSPPWTCGPAQASAGSRTCFCKVCVQRMIT